MEIEVGEYGRTNKGKIFIFVWVENANYILVKTRNEKQNNDILNFDKYYLDKDEEIVKHSKNIIDLIEVNDLVKTKGEKTIIHIYDNDTLEAVKEDIEEGHFTIETIVTHEMFEGIEYKVEEDK